MQPYQLGNSHPRFWGWVLGSGTPMGVIAEMLAAATDSVSGIYSFVSNNYVELQVLDWCKEMLGYPLDAGGLLTSGCSASNLIALAVARNAGAGFDVRREGLAGAPAGTDGAPRRLTVYCSAEAHSSLTKAVELLGMGTRSLRRVPADDLMRIDLEALAGMVARDRDDGLLPVCVVGVAGTTNTGSIDDLPALADFCEREGLWFHVDGAFGAWAAIAPESRHLVAGMERADSLAFDLHKWMNLTYPVGCVLVRDAEAQLRTFSLTPSYLAHGEGERGLTAVDVPWLSDYGFELSRGFHALKVWMTLKEHGTEKFGARDPAEHRPGAGTSPAWSRPRPSSSRRCRLRSTSSASATCAPAWTTPRWTQLNKEIELELQERGIAVPSVVDRPRPQVPARGGHQPPQPPRGLRPAGARGRLPGRRAMMPSCLSRRSTTPPRACSPKATRARPSGGFRLSCQRAVSLPGSRPRRATCSAVRWAPAAIATA